VRRPVTLLALTLLLLAPASARAQQDDILKQARSATTRSESIRILERHLASRPEDVDARLLYGQMLSWEARYDDARRELERVLAAAPDYLDARVALMNVEWWSGRRDAARALSDGVLLRQPGHPQARLVRQRLDAADRPWGAGVHASFDTFSDDRDAWHEQQLSLSRQTPAGAVVLRGSRAARFGLDDQQIELEFYPVLRPGTYAFIGAGVSNDHVLYPSNRFAFDIYQSAGNNFEFSAGYRRLGFDDAANAFVGTLSKYHGLWLFTGRVQHVTVRDSDGETSASLHARRYFGATGTSFAGIGYGHGLSREEIRGAGDFARGTSDNVRGELDLQTSPRVRLQFSVRGGRERRAAADALWQTTASGGLVVRF
jgi:YaiO family outer membrane protein